MTKKIPQIRFKGFKEDWEEKKLGDIASSFDYGMNKAGSQYDGTNRYIRITDIDDESRRFKKDDLKSPSELKKEDSKYLLKDGDILFARTGASVGKTYIYNKKDGKVFFAGFLIRASVNLDQNPYFVFTQTLRKNYINFVKIMSQRSGQPGINANEYKLFKLFLPNLEEQEKIGALFEKVDSLIEGQERAVDSYKGLKKSLLQKMFPKEGEKIPQLRFPGFDGEWEENKINKFSKKNKLKNKDNLIDNVESVSNKYGFIRQEDQFDNRVASDDLSNYYIIEKGMFAYNPSRINVGSIAYKDNNIVSVVSPLYVSFLLNKNLSDYFFYYWLETSNFIKFRDNYSEGSVRTTLSYESFSNIPIILPSLPEQKKIGDFFKKLDNLIEDEEKYLEDLKVFKKALLQKMFV
ncbi:MAG: restriction endonuclease subunit S [Peptoniphilaceae bacterium]|nr:restriction endonuclease subunit S [Peptoniphilaceae bacterium]MDY3923330.1 restriction endonuclease subunit S [Ezakiella sp.]